jgi:sialidase-1
MNGFSIRLARALLLSTASLLALPFVAISVAGAADVAIVRGGRAADADVEGREWRTVDGRLTCSGTGNYIRCPLTLGGGDARVRVRLAISNLKGSAASFVIGESHFGFSGRDGRPFVEGAIFGPGTAFLDNAIGLVREGEPFTFEVAIKDGTARFIIDGREVRSCRLPRARDKTLRFGLRPWRSTMVIEEFTASGDLVTPPALPVEETHLWTSGQGSYHTYRIPAIVSTVKGTLLAFCEGRKGGRGDAGDIDILMRRSTDGGKTWSESRVIWDEARNTCGNPCPVVDRETGRISLLLTWNRGDDHERNIIAGTSREPRKPFVCFSEDDGETWSKPRDLSASAKDDGWGWYATGPGIGIQLTRGAHEGRLVIPANHSSTRYEDHKYGAHVVYSDDHGKTWRRSAPIRPGCNESQAFERVDGAVVMNMRSYNGKGCRAVAASEDGGRTWPAISHDEALIESVCQASVLRYSWPDGDKERSRVLFSNPATKRGRTRMTVRVSYDEGRTWPASRLIHAGGSAYSCLVRMPGGDVGCLYEKDGYKSITLATMSIDWLDAAAEGARGAE